MPQKRPLVAIVTLTCNQKEVTLQCLESLSACDYTNRKVVLVDNGSSDNVVAEVEKSFPDVTCLRSETNQGAAGGRNIGIDHAVQEIPFDYIMFIDNDTVVQPNFLDKLVDGLVQWRDKGVSIASSMIYSMGTEKEIDCAGGAMVNFYTGSTQTRGHGEIDSGQYSNESFPKAVPTTAIIMDRQTLEKGRHYDVAFDPYGFEDLDMVIRCQGGTGPFLFVPDSIVYHKGTKTGFTGYTGEYAQLKAKNMMLFLKRHATPWQWFCFNLVVPLLGIRTVLREIAKGNFGAVAGLVKGYFGSKK